MEIDGSMLITDPRRSALMGRVRRSGTAPELAVARLLSELRMGYRKNVRALPGSPDFANRSRRWVIFVNGCYWHHHRCPRGTTPGRNREFWTAKFAKNRARDALAAKTLRRAGYRVMILWECQIRSPGVMRARMHAMFSNDHRSHP